MKPGLSAGLRLAFAGGGTGGHIVPGLHLLAHVRERGALLSPVLDDVVWFVSGRAIEERVFAGAHDAHTAPGFERVVLELEPHGGGAPSRSTLVLRTPAAILRARSALKRHRCNVLLGLGGFISLPAVLAARSLGIPVALLEINARPGRATRVLTRFSARVFHAWRETVPALNAASHVWIGPPLAPIFAAPACSRQAEECARVELGFHADRPLLLVLGGSQGSQALNRFMRTQAPALVAHGVQVLHQTGPNKLGEGCAEFCGYRAVEFVDPMHRALLAATLVLCRGGASTLAEIAALRRPAIVAPYPHHEDRHQEHNARELGLGVRIVQDGELDVALLDELVRLCGASAAGERAAMRAALAHAVPLDACARLYAGLAELVHAHSAAE